MSIARILRPATALAATLSVWRAARDTHRVLVRLSRRELADIGLHEGDIEVSSLIGLR